MGGMPNERTKGGVRAMQLKSHEDRNWLYKKEHREFENECLVVDGDQFEYRLVGEDKKIVFFALLELKRADRDINQLFRDSIHETLWKKTLQGPALQEIGRLMRIPVYIVAFLQPPCENKDDERILKYSVCELNELKRDPYTVWKVMTPDRYRQWIQQLRDPRKAR